MKKLFRAKATWLLMAASILMVVFPALAAAEQSLSDVRPLNVVPFQTFSATSSGGTAVTITTHGNILAFTSPNSVGRQYEHLNAGALGEGYVLGYTSPLTGAYVTQYDVGSAEVGFGAPTTLTGGGTVQCNRNTTDGVLQLRQTFINLTASKEIMVQMVVRNLSPFAVNNIILRRQADLDVDTGGAQGWASFANTWARTTQDGVWAWNDPSRVVAPGTEAHGMVMRVIQRTQGTWQAKVTANILDVTANPASVVTPVVAPTDYGATLQFNVGTLLPGTEARFDMRYMRF